MYTPPGTPQSGMSPQDQGSSVLGMVGNLALGMGLFEIGRRTASPWIRGINVALGAAAKRYLRGTAGAAAASTARGMPGMPGTIGGGIANRVFGKLTGAYPAQHGMRNTITAGGNYPSLSGMLMATSVVAQGASVLRVGKYIGAYKTYQAAINRSKSAGVISGPRRKLKNAASFFTGRIGGVSITGGGSFRDRLVGNRLLDLQSTYLPTLPAFYAAEQALGFMPGQHHREGPNWANPLSVAADVGKF